MNTEKKELKLTDITRYIDVETGQLQLTIGCHTKRIEAIWLSNIRFGDDRQLPRGIVPVSYKNHRQWLDCPRISLNRKTHVWIVPLDCDRWVDMGTNLYLCEQGGWSRGLPVRIFLRLAEVLQSNEVRQLTIEAPRQTLPYPLFSEEGKTGNNIFWDF